MQFNQIFMNTTSLCHVRQITTSAETEKQKCQQGHEINFFPGTTWLLFWRAFQWVIRKKEREIVLPHYYIFDLTWEWILPLTVSVLGILYSHRIWRFHSWNTWTFGWIPLQNVKITKLKSSFIIHHMEPPQWCVKHQTYMYTTLSFNCL